jgi:hypothetical protein
LTLTNEAVLLVDWLNLSIRLKDQRRAFGADLVVDLMKVAQEQAAKHGCERLARAHFVAERFSPAVEEAIGKTFLAQLHQTRTAKEQADLVLAVLTMDHLHSGTGCPKLFILATGDQDFIPLIERIVLEGAQVALIVASTDNLTPEYKNIAAQQNVALLPITKLVQIDIIQPVSGDRSSTVILGLLRVCMSGGVLGGDQKRNTQLMEQWGLLSSGADADVQMEGLIRDFARVEQRRVALPGRKPNGNRHVTARRTSLNFRLDPVSNTVVDADWVLRRAGTSSKPVTVGELGTGRFSDDDGSRLDRVLISLKAVGWLTERPDGTFETRLEWAGDGLLEPLWRVVCEVKRRAHDQHSPGVARDDLWQDLRSTPIAREGERRGGTAAKDAIDLARNVGVIDAVPAGDDGYALAVVESHPIAQQAAAFLSTLGKILGPEAFVSIPEHELLRRMSDHDERKIQPVFGYDIRDRQRVLRILKRSKLIEVEKERDTMRLKRSAWLRSLSPRLFDGNG